MDSAEMNIDQEIVFETLNTNYECKIGPVLATDIKRTIRTPTFSINSVYLTKCYLEVKWDADIAKGIQIRLVCESNTDINNNQPKIKKIVIKQDTDTIYESKDGELYTNQYSSDYFYWYDCYCKHNIYCKAIRIKCVIALVCTIIKKCIIYGCENLTASRDVLYDRLNKLFEDRQFADVKINVGDKTFSAHKSILGSNPVFAAMLGHEMTEKKESVINIHDIESDVFAVLLKFLYLGEFNIDSTITYEFLLKFIVAADMYQMEDLKDKLTDKIIKYMDVNNAVNFLIIADRYNISKMKEESLIFIGANAKEIKQTSAFKTMITTHTTLATELLCFFMNESTETLDKSSLKK